MRSKQHRRWPRRTLALRRRWPRPTLALRRRPRLWWALVLVASLTAGAATSSMVGAARRAEAAWGNGTEILVATRELRPGTLLDATNTAVVRHPEPIVPAGTLTALSADQRVAETVYEGEPVRRARLAPNGLSAVAARLPPGTRAVSIPADPGAMPPLTIGDRVEIVVALAPEAAGGGPPGFTLGSALVVDVGEQNVAVAVEAPMAAKVAVALAQGAVSLALVGR